MGILLCLSGIYLLFIAGILNAETILHAILFKVFPCILGLLLLIAGVYETGLINLII